MTLRLLETLKRIMLFLVLLLFFTAVLALLNWVPVLIQKDTIRKFSSVDAAKKELHIKKIYLPSYIPEDLDLAWPPAEIYGQDAPFRAAIMHLSSKSGGFTNLVIHQIEAGSRHEIKPRIKFSPKRPVSEVQVKGRKAFLGVGVCDEDVPCSRLSWDEDDVTITLIGKFQAQNIMKIASSMLPEE